MEGVFMRYFLLILLLLLLAVGLLFLIAELIRRQLVNRKTFSLPAFLRKWIKGNEMPDAYAADAAEAEKRFLSLPLQRVELTAGDGAHLRALVLSPRRPNGKLIIACHGARSSGKGEFCFFAPDFFRLGYTLILPDHRGCGDSDGDYMGYGTHESRDAFLWVEYAKTNFPDMERYLLGVSMGAATVLMMSRDNRTEADIQGMIADCSYTSAWDEFSYQMKASFHLTEFPLLPVCDFLNRHICGYSFRDASPIRAVKFAKCPILFIHGGADDFVPVYMLEQLYDACTTDKYRLTIPGAPHARSYYIDPQRYTKAVEAFIKLTQKPSANGYGSIPNEDHS